jgi:hypothetical protein
MSGRAGERTDFDDTVATGRFSVRCFAFLFATSLHKLDASILPGPERSTLPKGVPKLLWKMVVEEAHAGWKAEFAYGRFMCTKRERRGGK